MDNGEACAKDRLVSPSSAWQECAWADGHFDGLVRTYDLGLVGE